MVEWVPLLVGVMLASLKDRQALLVENLLVRQLWEGKAPHQLVTRAGGAPQSTPRPQRAEPRST